MIAQMTLRRVPDELEKGLRARARRTGHSLNRTAIELLREALGVSRPADARRRDLSAFTGQWDAAEAEEFARNIRIFEHIDNEVWSK